MAREIHIFVLEQWSWLHKVDLLGIKWCLMRAFWVLGYHRKVKELTTCLSIYVRDLSPEELANSDSWLALHGLDSELSWNSTTCMRVYRSKRLWPLQLHFQLVWKSRLISRVQRTNPYFSSLIKLTLLLFHLFNDALSVVVMFLLVFPNLLLKLKLAFKAFKLVRCVRNFVDQSSVAGDTWHISLLGWRLLVRADGQLLFPSDFLIVNHLCEVNLALG